MGRPMYLPIYANHYLCALCGKKNAMYTMLSTNSVLLLLLCGLKIPEHTLHIKKEALAVARFHRVTLLSTILFYSMVKTKKSCIIRYNSLKNIFVYDIISSIQQAYQQALFHANLFQESFHLYLTILYEV